MAYRLDGLCARLTVLLSRICSMHLSLHSLDVDVRTTSHLGSFPLSPLLPPSFPLHSVSHSYSGTYIALCTPYAFIAQLLHY